MTRIHHGLTRLDRFTKACLDHQALNDSKATSVLPQFFGRLAPANPLQWSGSKEELVAIFESLVDDMLETDIVEGPADAGMTFFGQFVDHDVTFDASSAIGTVADPRGIRNIRTPNLDLDCVYGDGPEASPHLYTSVDGHEGFLLFGREDSPLDLARNCKGTALIGDPRNDENIFVSQLQGIFICAHNILLNEVINGTPLGQTVKTKAMEGTEADVWSAQILPPMSDFQIVRRFMRLHYQFITMTDFMPQMVVPEIVSACMESEPFGSHAALMPVEFSGAVYRFGHATAQDAYSLKVGGPSQTFFEKPGFEARGPEHDIEMAALFGPSAQKARPVGTTVAASLFELPFVQHGFTLSDGTEVSKQQARKLPLRNILRDRFTLHISNGQRLAGLLGFDTVPVPQKLADHHISKTPLWFYALQEADAANGKLDKVGGTVVASVMARLLRLDPTSYVHIKGFRPLPDFATMANLTQFVEAHRDGLPQRTSLWCGPSA
ncbi:peroxidase family protein [Roseibium sp. MMSF_3544]|uniref:peroxidase family protein n=1 Tax=unclassified Roseibium TaxID=2629323 RepID=UPI00273DBD2C|nr:peroxidase family protein [Roseibium sp. MMSF_3544]